MNFDKFSDLPLLLSTTFTISHKEKLNNLKMYSLTEYRIKLSEL